MEKSTQSRVGYVDMAHHAIGFTELQELTLPQSLRLLGYYAWKLPAWQMMKSMKRTEPRKDSTHNVTTIAWLSLG